MTNWAGMSQNYMAGAANTYANMDKKRFAPPPPPKTAGGAIGAGLGYGTAGAEAAESGWMGSTIQGSENSGAWGGAIGAGVGMLAYYLS